MDSSMSSELAIGSRRQRDFTVYDLIEAINNDDVNDVRYIMDHGVDLNQLITYHGHEIPILYFAVKKGNMDIIDLIAGDTPNRNPYYVKYMFVFDNIDMFVKLYGDRRLSNTKLAALIRACDEMTCDKIFYYAVDTMFANDLKDDSKEIAIHLINNKNIAYLVELVNKNIIIVNRNILYDLTEMVIDDNDDKMLDSLDHHFNLSNMSKMYHDIAFMRNVYYNSRILEILGRDPEFYRHINMKNRYIMTSIKNNYYDTVLLLYNNGVNVTYYVNEDVVIYCDDNGYDEMGRLLVKALGYQG